MKKQCMVKGTIEMFVTEPDGTKKLIRKISNSTSINFANRLALNLITDQDMRMDNLFVANTQPPVSGQDGMVFYDDAADKYYSFITTKTHPTTTTVVFAGTFTGTDVDIDELQLGNGWLSLGSVHGFVSPEGETGFGIALTPSTWVSASFLVAQTCTINWTIAII